MIREVWIRRLQKTAPRVHCLTNPVSMWDVANILLAAGGSAIMATDVSEIKEITELCQATLLNMGVPDEDRLCSIMLAGMQASKLGRPVVLDPVGAGASLYRKKAAELVLEKVKPSLIRCNQEEACALLDMQKGVSGGVESSVSLEAEEQLYLAEMLARTLACTVLVSGTADAVSDGRQSVLLTGGDERIRRITGSGCMLSALCALFCGTGMGPYEAACAAGSVWKKSSELAGRRTDEKQGGIGSFHVHLFDAADMLCHGKRTV